LRAKLTKLMKLTKFTYPKVDFSDRL